MAVEQPHLQRLCAASYLLLRLIQLLPHRSTFLILAGQCLALLCCLLGEVLLLDVCCFGLCICSCLCVLRVCQALLKAPV
jgi:hypothetical protein